MLFLFVRHTKMIDGVLAETSGTFEFRKCVYLHEKYRGRPKNVLYGTWKFPPEIKKFPSFSASQMTEAFNWANKYGKRTGYVSHGRKVSIIEELKTVIKEDAIDQWLDTPNPHFDLKNPRDMIGTDGECHLWNMLYRLQSGMPS